MSKFLELLETCMDEVGGDPMEEKGDRIVIDALTQAGIKTGASETGCFDFWTEDGEQFTVEVRHTNASEDDEALDRENQEDDDAARAVKMADKVTDDDPRTSLAKKGLNQQVGATYNKLEQGLRGVTQKLKFQ